MKICPTCQQTYTDDNLNFCLNDGAVLNQMYGQNAPPETVFMNPPRATDPAATFGKGEQITLNKQVQPYSVQPKKNSKNWLWILGIFALILVLCGGSLGLMALIGSQVETSKNTLQNVNRIPGNTGPVNKSATPNNSDNNRTLSQSINFEGWDTDNSAYGETDYDDGELTIKSKSRGTYYVLVAKEDYKTENANTKVTLRNPQEANSSLGYGLIFHSNPQPLQQDYAFLIDALRKKYRIVYHSSQKENIVVNWTDSAAIKDSVLPNVLEVRDTNGSMDFYINDQKVTNLKNIYGYKGGVTGIYAGDMAPIAFSKLEIYK